MLRKGIGKNKLQAIIRDLEFEKKMRSMAEIELNSMKLSNNFE
jgi:hypothetical protein